MCDKLFSKKKPQKVIVPQGLVREDETTVIEIPEEYKDEPVVVVTAKPCGATCPNVLSQNLSNIRTDQFHSNHNGTIGFVRENFFEGRAATDSNYSHSVGCNTSCPSIRNRSPASGINAGNESLGIFGNTTLDNTFPSPAQQSFTTGQSIQPTNNESLGLLRETVLSGTAPASPLQQASITNYGAEPQAKISFNNTAQSFSPHSATPGMTNSGNASLGMLSGNIISSTHPFVPQGNITNQHYQSIVNEDMGLLNSSALCEALNISSIPTHQTVTNETLNILEPQQMSANCRAPQTIKTIKHIVITTTSTTDHLQNGNTISQGTLAMERLQQPALSTSLGGANTIFPNNASSYMCPSECNTSKRKLDFSASTSTNYSGSGVPVQDFATSTPIKPNFPIGVSQSGNIGLEQSIVRDGSATGISSLQNNSGNISKALDEYLRDTEEREQNTLQTDLKKYQEARRRLVADTTQLSSYNKTI